MSKSQSDSETAKPNKQSVALLLGTIGDTTWRMFIPTIGLTVTGLLADKQFHTTPWIMILGIVCGAVIAGLLVRQQIRKVNE